MLEQSEEHRVRSGDLPLQNIPRAEYRRKNSPQASVELCHGLHGGNFPHKRCHGKQKHPPEYELYTHPNLQPSGRWAVGWFRRQKYCYFRSKSSCASIDAGIHLICLSLWTSCPCTERAAAAMRVSIIGSRSGVLQMISYPPLIL